MSVNEQSSASSDYRSVTGQKEPPEPAAASASSSSSSSMTTPTPTPNPSQSQNASQSNASVPQQRQASTSITASAPPNLIPASFTSAKSSPQTSRNTSPVRKDSRPQSLTGPITGQPSAAAIQRALSATSIPQLQQPGNGPISEAVSRLPRTAKSISGSGMNTPEWPVSPRLKSPPPTLTNSRKGSAAMLRKSEATNAPPSIKVEDATQQTATPSKFQGDEPRRTEQQLQPPTKVSSRGPSGKSMLETVEETSSDSVRESPAALHASAELKYLTRIPQEDNPATRKEGQESDKHAPYGESGNESTGSKVGRRGRSSSISDQIKGVSQQKRPGTKSYTPLASAKSRQADGKQNMTVETETVASIPQSALNLGDRTGSGRIDPSGPLRPRPSTETIRPKKERRKPPPKARSLTQGTGMYTTSVRSPLLVQKDSFEHTRSEPSALSESCDSSTSPITEDAERTPRPWHEGYWPRFPIISRPNNYVRTMSDKWLRKASSKADIFEARVSSTMDEANTSDSDETLILNTDLAPVEQARRPRHHSRTPSVASSHSVADQRSGGVRGLENMLGDRRVAGKRSMKFSNNAYNEDSPDSKNGTIRSGHARHYGKFGRGGSHGGNYDPDSPFTQASKLRNTHANVRQSRPNSPRSPQTMQPARPPGLFPRKEQSFDMEGVVADDERTPLMGTVRTPRTPRHARRLHVGDGSVRSIDEYYSARDGAWCSRFSGCLLGLLVVLLVVMSAVGFLLMSNRPMFDVKIKRIQNVLASEQELMLDLLVGATNPNALGITITEMDVNIFAKSKHSGSGVTPNVTSSTTQPLRRRDRRWHGTESPEAKNRDSSPWQDLSGHWHAPSTSGKNRDDGPDPPDDGDLDSDVHTMLLGRIFHFDQALTFEGSPIKRHEHYSVGELRLMHPGNKTETGGTARWESILQHPFELIVRGVLKYGMPVSGRPVSVGVGASVEVHPEDGVDDLGRMRITPVKHEEHWQWIDWDAVKDALDKENETGG